MIWFQNKNKSKFVEKTAAAIAAAVLVFFPVLVFAATTSQNFCGGLNISQAQKTGCVNVINSISSDKTCFAILRDLNGFAITVWGQDSAKVSQFVNEVMNEFTNYDPNTCKEEPADPVKTGGGTDPAGREGDTSLPKSGTGNAKCSDIGLVDKDGICVPGETPTGFLDTKNWQELVEFFVKLFLGVAGIVAVIFAIYGGFMYMTSAGAEEQAEKGRATFVNALIGLVIIILSYVVISVVIDLLTAKQG